jgi:hypothetical protein
MPGAIVEQLTVGVKVQCADGTEVICTPLPLGIGMQIVDCWDKRGNPQVELAERAAARLEVVRLFTQQYPDLALHISAGDVEALVPDFFWAVTGAAVVRPATPSTGTSSGAPTAPPGESSPT